MKSHFIVNTSLEKGLPIYLKSVGSHQYQEHVVRKNGYPDYHYLHTIEGCGYLKLIDKEFVIDENTAFFLSPGVPHEYFAKDKKWSTIWLTFNGPAVEQIFKVLKISDFEIINLLDKRYLQGIIEAIGNKASLYNYIISVECSHLIYNFLLQLSLNLHNRIEKNYESNYFKLLPVLKFIEENFYRNITLDELSAIINVTPQHLCNVFKKTFQITPYEYLIRMRIQKAKQMLMKDIDIQIKQVCFDVGFKNPSYFSFMFKKLEGISPIQFKKLFV